MKQLPNLSTLTLRSNSITHLENGTFANHKYSERIDLHSNKIGEIGPMVFHNSTLIFLDLSHNAIKDLKKIRFSNSTSVILRVKLAGEERVIFGQILNHHF